MRPLPPPMVTYALVLIQLLVLLAWIVQDSVQQWTWLQMWAVVPSELVASVAERGWTLLSALLINENGLAFLANAFVLVVFGRSLERICGWRIYCGFYAGGGAVALLLRSLLTPTSTVPVVGASTAVAALLGAYSVIQAGSRVLVRLGSMRLITRAYWFLGVWLGIQFANSVRSGGATMAIAYFTLLCGFAIGMVAAFIGRESGRHR